MIRSTDDENMDDLRSQVDFLNSVIVVQKTKLCKIHLINIIHHLFHDIIEVTKCKILNS